MNHISGFRLASRAGVLLLAATVLLFFTTPAYAGCKICIGEYPYPTCVPTAPGAGGYWSCTVVGGHCILNDICEPILSDDFDVDGRIIGSREDVARSLLNNAHYDDSPMPLHDYLAQNTDEGIVRNCKGLAIARIGSVGSADLASDLVL